MTVRAKVALPAALTVLSVSGAGVAACGGHEDHESANRQSPTHGMEHGGTPVAETTGLESSAGGYTLLVRSSTLAPDRDQPFTFRIADASGKTVRQFGIDQTKRMHLLLLRRDLTGYQHLHPEMDASGNWSVPVRLGAPGPYRAFADFVVGGKRFVLGIDLTGPGRYAPAILPGPRNTATTERFTVRLSAGALRPGKPGDLRFEVQRDGRPVRELEPYLRALGHLVVLRERDLSYLHVHPGETRGTGPDIPFTVDLPSASLYRAFLQFQVGGTVHTAAFTIWAGT